MTDLELDSIAEGLFKYLQEQSDSPLDAISILGVTLLKVYAAGTDGQISIATFAKDFERSLVESFNAASAQGTETRQ